MLDVNSKIKKSHPEKGIIIMLRDINFDKLSQSNIFGKKTDEKINLFIAGGGKLIVWTRI